MRGKLQITEDSVTAETFRWISTRSLLTCLLFLGITVLYTMKINLSIAIVAMAGTHPVNTSQKYTGFVKNVYSSDKQVENPDLCPMKNNDTEHNNQEGEFDWDEATQGHVLAAYYYGYVATQLLGGRLSEIMGAKYVFGPGVLLAGVFALISPTAARLDLAAFIAVRILQGAASGVVLPASQTMVSKWYPAIERSSLGGILHSGSTFAALLASILSGILAGRGRWPMVFYLFGILAVIWFIPWFFLVYDTPEEHPRISKEERNYIIKNRGKQNSQKNRSVPWLKILISPAVWAHCLYAVGIGWTTITFMQVLPTFLSNVLHFNLQQSGVISAFPGLLAGFSLILFGYMSQWILKKNYISRLTTYRIFNTVCTTGVATCLLVVTLAGCNSVVIISCLMLTAFLGGAYAGGSLMNHLDLTNNYAGTVSGMSTTALNLSGIISPLITGWLTNNNQTLTQWHTVFYIVIGITVSVYLIYLIFGSAEEQSWNSFPSKQRRKCEESNDDLE